METLKFCKVRNVKSPNRAHSTDAGIDFYVPNDLSITEMKEKNKASGTEAHYVPTEAGSDKVQTIVLDPNESILIPSGIKVKVPDGYMMMYDNKSGIASKKGLLIGAKIVDVGYEGECHVDLHNVSKFTQKIDVGDKICQGILIPVNFAIPKEVESEEVLYKDGRSDRGTGGFGSSGTV